MCAEGGSAPDAAHQNDTSAIVDRRADGCQAPRGEAAPIGRARRDAVAWSWPQRGPPRGGRHAAPSRSIVARSSGTSGRSRPVHRRPDSHAGPRDSTQSTSTWQPAVSSVVRSSLPCEREDRTIGAHSQDPCWPPPVHAACHSRGCPLPPREHLHRCATLRWLRGRQGREVCRIRRAPDRTITDS